MNKIIKDTIIMAVIVGSSVSLTSVSVIKYLNRYGYKSHEAYEECRRAYFDYLVKHRELPVSIDFLPLDIRTSLGSPYNRIRYYEPSGEIFYVEPGSFVVIPIGCLKKGASNAASQGN